MQIKFLNIYDYYDVERCQAKYELLEFWQKAIVHDQIDFVHCAKVEFKNYSFTDYPDQEKLCKEIKNSVSSSFNYAHNTTYWWLAGKRYGIFKELYDDLAKTHHLMELIITVEA